MSDSFQPSRAVVHGVGSANYINRIESPGKSG